MIVCSIAPYDSTTRPWRFVARRGPSGTAVAQPYRAQQTGDVVRLEDTRAQTVVSIVPSVGDVAFEMKVKGHDVLYWPFSSVDDFKASPNTTAFRFSVRGPTDSTSRRFTPTAQRYAFDMQLGNVRGAIPIHGFLIATNQWRWWT